MKDSLIPYETRQRFQWRGQNRVTLAIQPNRFELFLPPLRLHLVDTLSSLRKHYQHSQPLPGLFLWGAQMLAWSLAGCVILPALVASPDQWRVLGWAGGWGMTGVILLHTGLKSLFIKEYLCLADGQLHIGTRYAGVSHMTSYPIAQIHNLRRAPDDCVSEGQLCFTYHDTVIAFGNNLTEAEANRVLKTLSHVITMPYHRIECVMFGTCPYDEDHIISKKYLYNPTVHLLMYPLVHLTEMRIDSATAKAHQIEQFLTYAVNALGTQFLKNHVIVNVYGSPDALHPNIRNNLTHFCKHVNYFGDVHPLSGHIL